MPDFMLVNLCDYKQSVTLIANSGVQFLDFGLTPQESAHYGRFVRKTIKQHSWGVLCAKRQTARYCASILI
ncbi:SrfB [Salmonella enterica subsp. enterica serovar Senftenberg str. A4-543]|uniref:SrfB n=1 Tax=Salmonella enterica subsp. enterica serovar Senftenberg str. A4-543 TaxID=913082 RepID=G5R000_SALSE|nr:SrfB [Salmonella enterica subsp. enterica serovar Senftenberg str. A4-543]